MIAAEDLALFAFADDPEEGWEAMPRHGLKAHTADGSKNSVTSCCVSPDTPHAARG